MSFSCWICFLVLGLFLLVTPAAMYEYNPVRVVDSSSSSVVDTRLSTVVEQETIDSDLSTTATLTSPRRKRLPFVAYSAQQLPTFIPHNRIVNATNLTKRRRNLQDADGDGNDQTESPCLLCNGANVLVDVLPVTSFPEFLPDNITCGDYWWFISQSFTADFSDTDLLAGCASFTKIFQSQCCAQLKNETLLDENGNVVVEREVPLSNYECEEQVRSVLLQDYDSAVLPLAFGKPSVDIEFFLDFYHITNLDVKKGSVEVFVWVNLKWRDPRLRWDNRADKLGDVCSTFNARASLDAELTEIWVPDFDLFNQIDGVQEMPEAMATVYRDGHVTWRRNGGLNALCWFSGLRQFPYDSLGCQFLMGGWTREENVRFILAGENGTGWTFGGDLAVYNEYRLIEERTETGYVESTGQNSMYFNFYFLRSRRFYVTKIVIPAIIFTCLAFGVFLLDLRVGERLTYGLTVLLVITAQSIVTTEFLPVTSQRLWINALVDGSFYWVLVCNLESVAVLWLYFLGDYEFHDLEVEEELLRRTPGAPADAQDSKTSDENEVENKETVSEEKQLGPAIPDEEHAVEVNRTIDGNSAVNEVFETDYESASRPLTMSVASANGTTTDSATSKVSNDKTKKKTTQTFRQRLMSRNGDMSRAERYRFIKNIDRCCFVVLPVAYMIFLIIMFSTINHSLWQDPPQDTYGGINTTTTT